jgi:tRNA threonylcarbamoyladenosine biosynthesis protein TsaE
MPHIAGQIGRMTLPSLVLHLADPEATEALARRMADLVLPGACILLSGPVGAGKSHFARAFIRHRLGYEGDIPSPTFTLVQSYESPDEEIWHADLYRLRNVDEVMELGLAQAMGQMLCLIEWPDRLGDLAPLDALHLTFRHLGEGREVTLDGPDQTLRKALQND